MRRSWTLPIALAALAATAIAVMGATITDLGPWYRSLRQPPWAPPDAAYGIAWTAIYALTAVAGVVGWRAMRTTREADWLIGFYALNGFLNILWSLLFFRVHRPDWSVIEVVGLWLSVGALILASWRRSIAAAILLIPYLCWVTFAGYLNLIVVRLNGPFV